jgi:urease accessory protein UreF
MTTKALLEELHHLIDSKKDNEAILQKVYEILKEDNAEGETDWWDEMTDEQRAQQEKAEEDIRLGRNLVPHEEAMKRAKKWLE